MYSNTPLYPPSTSQYKSLVPLWVPHCQGDRNRHLSRKGIRQWERESVCNGSRMGHGAGARGLGHGAWSMGLGARGLGHGAWGMAPLPGQVGLLQVQDAGRFWNVCAPGMLLKGLCMGIRPPPQHPSRLRISWFVVGAKSQRLYVVVNQATSFPSWRRTLQRALRQPTKLLRAKVSLHHDRSSCSLKTHLPGLPNQNDWGGQLLKWPPGTPASW